MLCNWPRDPNNELSPGHGWYCYDIELTCKLQTSLFSKSYNTNILKNIY